MFTLLSPAKKLLTFTRPYLNETTEPFFIKKAVQLAQLMKDKSMTQIGELMNLSRDLSRLNYDRYQQFNLQSCSLEHSYPALFLFQGDVYQGLSADSWTLNDLHFAQQHLGILSGLYGLLRPLDRIQPYRLEMGVKLANPAGANLYEFWREAINEMLNQQLGSQRNPILINLASTEYFKAVHEKKIIYPIITDNFYEQKNNEIKMIGLYAKKARGLMAKFIMQNQIDAVDDLKEFHDAGYVFKASSSSEQQLNFVRVH